MPWWRALPEQLAQGDVVLVTVAATQGSAPREAGTSMLVTLNGTVDTIGGGHLEWEAMAQARAMLLQPSAMPAMQRLSLGASLGQCCGGVVWLVFERIAQADAALWRMRAVQLQAGAGLQRTLASTELCSQWGEVAATSKASPADALGCFVSAPQAGRWQISYAIRPALFPITVFGAGHVGAAVVELLATLDVQIRWVDPRDDLFGRARDKVECIVSDAPEEAVASAPPGSFFLVLTHSHALDLALCEQILRRDDFAWFGLIGSKTKRARFEHRLQALGLDTVRMCCPIGVPGIRDKSPQVLAIAVVAQLLQVREARASIPSEVNVDADTPAA